MKPSMAQENLDFIKMIVKFATCCGFLPNCDFNLKQPRFLFVNRAASALLILIVISFSCYFYKFKEQEFYGTMILNTFGFVKGFLISAALINGYTTAITRNTTNYQKFLHLTLECCRLFGKSNQRQIPVIIIVSLFNIYLIGVNTYNIYLWNYNVGFERIRYFVFQSLQGYLFYMISMYLFAYIIFIKKSLRAFRKVLQNWDPKQSLTRLKETCINFATICDLIDCFNDIFGIQLFLTLILMLYDILWTINIIIVTDFKENHPTLFAIQICWTFTLIVPAILAATFCEKMKNEIRKIKEICTKAGYRWYEPEIRELFSSLLDQINNRSPQISAGGYFYLDNNLLFTHVNILLTYLVVVVQISISSYKQ